MPLRIFEKTEKAKHGGVPLGSRTNTTQTVSVPSQCNDFTDIIPSAHITTISRLLVDLGTARNDGLTKNEAGRRLESCGENVLEGESGVSALSVLLRQVGKH